MKVEELIGSKVWIKSDQFRSVPGKIVSTSNVVDLDDLKSSISQSTFRVEVHSEDVIEILGSDISTFDHATSKQPTHHKPRGLVQAGDDSSLVDVRG
jgi:hypothetical protein